MLLLRFVVAVDPAIHVRVGAMVVVLLGASSRGHAPRHVGDQLRSLLLLTTLTVTRRAFRAGLRTRDDSAEPRVCHHLRRRRTVVGVLSEQAAHEVFPFRRYVADAWGLDVQERWFRGLKRATLAEHTWFYFSSTFPHFPIMTVRKAHVLEWTTYELLPPPRPSYGNPKDT